MVQQITFDFKQQATLFWQKKYYFIIPFLVICILFLIGSYRLKKIYKSSTTILVEDERAFSRNEQYFLSNDGLQRFEKVAKIKGMILSYDYLKELIMRVGLDRDKTIYGQALSTYPNMKGLTDTEIVERWLLEYLRKNIQVESHRTEFITIEVEYPEPDKAYQIANSISHIFIEKSHRNQLQGLQETLNFTNERLSYYQNKVAESEKKLQNYRMGVVQDQVESGRDERLIKINQVLQATNTKITELERTIQNLDRSMEGSNWNVMMPENSVIESLKTSITDITSQILTILVDSDLQDIRLMRLNEKLASFRNELLKEYMTIIKTNLNGIGESKIQLLSEKAINQLDLELMRKRRMNLNTLINSYVAKAEKVTIKETNLSLLEQELETNREMYNMFLQRTRNLQTEAAYQNSDGAFNYKIIEPAYIPLYPEKPNKPFLMIIGVFIGTLMGLALILIMIFLDHSFRQVEEVEAYLQLPILGTVSRLPINGERPIWTQQIAIKNAIFSIGGLILFVLIILSDLFWSIFLAFLNKIG